MKAANQGYAIAQFSLGAMYDIGEGVPQDNYSALEWYSAAALQGSAAAQYNLGFLYQHGRGVQLDNTLAWSGMRRQRNKDSPTLSTIWDFYITLVILSHRTNSRPGNGI